MTRIDGRKDDELRAVKFTPNFTAYAEGSVLIETGNTRVLCNATIQDSVPPWLEGRGQGWLTAEYAMLPRSTHQRIPRSRGHGSARSQEIQRLIGRSLRAGLNLNLLGERTIIVDCDVLQADGGTRTASISGGYVAVALALKSLIVAQIIPPETIRTPIAAVSVGVVENEQLLDLCYEEDSSAEVDLNVVMTGAGQFVEVQGTAEGPPFSRQTLNSLVDLAATGIDGLLAAQAEVLAVDE